MSKAKILLSDYKTALINRNTLRNENHINKVMELVHKIKSSKFYNYYYWIPLYRDNENDLIRKLMTNKEEYHEQLKMSDSFRLIWSYVDNDEFKNQIESLDLIKDDFIVVGLDVVEMVNKYKSI